MQDLLSSLPLLLTVGAIGGFLSGMLGVGGGIIFVPALYYCLHDMHAAVGTSLAIVLATGAASSFHHNKRGAVGWEIVRGWAPFIVAGVAAGALIAHELDGYTLEKIFGGLMLPIAAWTAFGRTPEKARKLHRAALRLFSFVTGALSSMIGVGGATLNVPMLVYLGEAPTRAMATSAALGLAVSLPGTLVYLFMGNVSIAALAVVPVSMLATPFGVRAAHRLPKTALRRIFAAVLVLVALRMLTS